MVALNLPSKRSLVVEKVNQEEERLRETLSAVDFYKRDDGRHYCTIDGEEHCISNHPYLLNTIKLISRRYFEGPLGK